MRFLALLLALQLAIAAPVAQTSPSDTIPGKYIVVLKKESTIDALDTESAVEILGTTPDSQFQIGDFRGMSFDASEDQVNAIRSNENVAYVEPDAIARASELTSEPNPPYGLGLISHTDDDYSNYIYDNSAGTGTYAYIIDTGIYTAHPDFGGRATFGPNFIDSSNNDDNGHGTHVAGTTGSNTYGVAKSTNLIAVKVLTADGTGTNSAVINGVSWAANDASSNGRAGRAVANMSLGSSFFQSINDAVAAAVQSGLFFAVAAGNNGADASGTSPASTPSACTVGAIDSTKTEASFSNYGSLVDIFAPGVEVESTWNDGGVNTISGTSMATPHITGLGAYLLVLEGPRSPTDLCARIVQLATGGISDLGPDGTPNAIAYNGDGQ